MKHVIFLDGVCQLCSREALFLKRQDREGRLEFVDISAEDFSASNWGLTDAAVHRYMHVRTPDGKILTGVEAFAEIWSQLPRYRWVAKLIRLPGLSQAAHLGYAVFARVRPWLPKRKTSVVCELR